jgi:hypothetical protein
MGMENHHFNQMLEMDLLYELLMFFLSAHRLPTDEDGGESEEVFQDFIAALRMLEGLPG